MTHANIAGTTGKLITVGVFGEEAQGAIFDLRWMLILIVVLVISDFWLGISESLRKHDHFRFSRAGRRTCQKLMEYFTYLLIGALIGLSITEPLGICSHVITAAIGLSIGCLWELDSILGHAFALHGIEWKGSIKRGVIYFLKKKNNDIGEAVEEALNEKGDKTNEKD